ncbi:MAG: thioredoxin domain-containing protein, partial [Planctomycetales bacterium]|nr:thioredoxin domain-containing protein [Planctomycetales bacterium]
ATGEPLFARSAAETAAWLCRDMQDPGGAFYATLDADSEGEEGRFYLWQPDQARDLLPGKQAALMERHLGLAKPPN